MNEPTMTLTLNVRFSAATAAALPKAAEKFGVTIEEMASAVLDAEFPYDTYTEDETAVLILSHVGNLYPDRWSELEPVYNKHHEQVDQDDLAEQAQFDKRLAETASVTLPPAMVEFMREIGRLFPELWDIFVGECIEAVLGSLPHYLDNAFSFESPKDRREAFRLVEEALVKYRASGTHHRFNRDATTLSLQSGPAKRKPKL